MYLSHSYFISAQKVNCIARIAAYFQVRRAESAKILTMSLQTRFENWRQPTAFLVGGVSLLAALILCEIGMRALTHFPISKSSNKIHDANLGYRLDPRLEQVDPHGFRNLPDTPKVFAAIGDSHTFGNNVFSKQAWPKIFERITGVPTYNFGIGSYGIFSYHYLVKNAVARGFSGAIVALYPANDFMARFSHCEIDRSSPFWSREIKRLSLRMSRCPSQQDKDKGVVAYMQQKTATGSAFKHLVADRIRADRNKKNYQEVLGTQESIDLFRVRRHFQYMDLSRDEIQPIWQAFTRMIRDWSAIAKDNAFLLGIVLLPSKERLLVEHARRENKGRFPPTLDDSLVKSVNREVELERRIINLARGSGLPVKSAIDRLLKAKDLSAKKGVPLYKVGDGHPYVLGYAAYALAANDLAREVCDGDINNIICADIAKQASNRDQGIVGF